MNDSILELDCAWLELSLEVDDFIHLAFLWCPIWFCYLTWGFFVRLGFCLRLM